MPLLGQSMSAVVPRNWARLLAKRPMVGDNLGPRGSLGLRWSLL
jgi:hypothetical protein